jgi:hypothetical protein
MEKFRTELQIYLDTNIEHFAQPHRLSRLPELVFLNVYGVPELISRNEFRQRM